MFVGIDVALSRDDCAQELDHGRRSPRGGEGANAHREVPLSAITAAVIEVGLPLRALTMDSWT